MPRSEPYPTAPVRCSTEGCTAQHAGNYWATVRANGAGWFHQKDGTVFCPEHVPDWVPAWRARQAAKRA